MKKLNTNNMKTVANLCWVYNGDVYFRPHDSHALVVSKPYGELSLKDLYRERKADMSAMNLKDFPVIKKCCDVYNRLIELCEVAEFRLNEKFFSIFCRVDKEVFLVKCDEEQNLFIQFYQDIIDVADIEGVVKFIKMLKLPNYKHTNKDYDLPMIKFMVKTFPYFIMRVEKGVSKTVAGSHHFIFFNDGANGIVQHIPSGYEEMATSWTQLRNRIKEIPFIYKEEGFNQEQMTQAERLYREVERYEMLIEGFNFIKRVDARTGKTVIGVGFIGINAQGGQLIIASFNEQGNIHFTDNFDREIAADKVAEYLVSKTSI